MRKKTAQFIEEHKSVKAPRKRGPKPGSKPHPNSAKNLAPPWPKGVSANPGGLPGTDLAAVIARRVFEQIEREGDAGMLQELRKGNAYAFSVLADRGYGKVTQKEELEITMDALAQRLLKGRQRLLKDMR